LLSAENLPVDLHAELPGKFLPPLTMTYEILLYDAFRVLRLLSMANRHAVIFPASDGGFMYHPALPRRNRIVTVYALVVWDLSPNTFSQVITLSSGIGEAIRQRRSAPTARPLPSMTPCSSPSAVETFAGVRRRS